MALAFRYRFVDFGTVFAAADGVRDADQGALDPCSLFANELVTDVGGTCCNGNESLAVIDHHFTREAQFPAASAAVLHKARYIRERFGGRDGVFWLVTHKQPDFDAFCSMYLARWILEDPTAILDWQSCGLHPDGWQALADGGKIDWFAPELRGLRTEQRWPLLMASYASIVDNSKHFPCPRSRALHSILYAALKRGRDYQSETSGAMELFDEIKTAIRDKRRNPIFDSVLENSVEFAPELAMLDREVEAYRRDVRRARKSIVYLQWTPGPFKEFFEARKDVPLLDERGAIRSQHRAADARRVATDGIYLRDPECLLFKEWARLDLENSSLGRGFEFTAVAYSGGRRDGRLNHTDYFFAIDPERANGRNLYRVWAQLQAQEVAALHQQEHKQASAENRVRRGFEERAGVLGSFFVDPWFDGQNYFCTIVATPNHGTQIAAPGIDAGLADDAIVELVRNEVEHSIYGTPGEARAAQVTVRDLSATRNDSDAPERGYDIAQLQQLEPPVARRFRLARVPLRGEVPLSLAGGGRLAQQIGETLWQVLYPDLRGARPADFDKRHLVIAPRCVGVWGDRGIAIAYKSADGKGDSGIENEFVNIVTLARDIDQLVADGAGLAAIPRGAATRRNYTEPADVVANLAEEIAARGEVLARKAAQIKHNLTLPNSDLLRRFYDATGIDELLATLRDLNQTAAEYLRREKLEEQARQLGASTATVAEVQSKLEWVEVFIVGVYAVDVIEIFSKHLVGENSGVATLVILASLPAFLLFTTFVLQPWKRKAAEEHGGIERPAWILIVVVAACVLGIIWAVWLFVHGQLPVTAPEVYRGG